MTTRPYELLVRFGINGAIAGASVRSITTVNGRDYEGDPEPLSGASDPAFTEFAKQFSAAAIVERDTAKSELAAEKTEHDATKASLATITAERDSLQSQVDELKPQVDTLPGLNGQITSLTAERDSLQSLSETLQQQVDTIPGMQEQITTLTAEVERLTALIPPPVDPDAVPEVITRTQARLVLHRAGLLDKVLEVIAAGGVEAQIWYEANEWHRASPVLAGMAQALGFTDEQVDNLFRAAGVIIT